MKQGEIRIIGGRWRGRKIHFPALLGLRPTPNRVRETLFNWLAPVVDGAYCLDAFAGSGALGIEALSRGAAYTLFLDQSPQVKRGLTTQLQLLGASNTHVYLHKIPTGLPAQFNFAPNGFNIIFLDPPFHQNLIPSCCHWLEQHHLLASTAYIYIEVEASLQPLLVPSNWQLLRSKITGQVSYQLFQRSSLLDFTDPSCFNALDNNRV